jgi:glutathione peroxidase
VNFYDCKVKNGFDEEVNLLDFSGKVVLVVNTASQCAFTSQYKGLEQLYIEYKGKGVEILAFPCNQFGAQEPGSNIEIRNFCIERFDITFPIMKKIDVNGDSADPLFKFFKKKWRQVF